MKLTYRPEIDGLRAISVIFVIFYHAEITILGYDFFEAGFIGVDIFFVISGYLITSLILKELVLTGKFSFLYFYERRARRILPALLFVMLLSLPFGWVYLLPSSFIDFSKSILYSIGFSSNFYFHFSGLEYGTIDGLFKPFLHTWSLSVEEQYYIIFPLTLILCFKYFRKYLIHILVSALLISLIIADWGSKNYPSITFYFLHSRMWELLAGSILAYLEIKKGRKLENKFLNKICPIFGLLLIFFSVLFYNDKMPHPSFFTIIPVTGVCLIIWFSNQNELITKILSSKLFVGTGLISYSLYLWHFPIFAFARIKDNTPSQYDKFEWIILTIVLSIITYFLIEVIFRNKKIVTKKVLLSSLSLFLVTIIYTNLYVIFKEGFKTKYQINENYTIDNDYYKKEWKNFNKNVGWPEFKDKNKLNVLIIGNSHAYDTFNSFYLNRNLFSNYEFSIINVHLACFYHFLVKEPLPLYCKQDFKYKDKTLASKIFFDSELIIFSTRWRDEDLNILEKMITKLKLMEKDLLILNNSLEVNVKIRRGFHILDFFVFRNNRLPNRNELIKIERKMFEQLKNREQLNKKLIKISDKKNVKILFKEDYLCNLKKKRCSVLTDKNRKISWDYGHYTLDGAKYLGKIIYNNNWFVF